VKRTGYEAPPYAVFAACSYYYILTNVPLILVVGGGIYVTKFMEATRKEAYK
jgi:hypothetical protein